MNPTTLNLLSISVFAFVLLSLVGPLVNISPAFTATLTVAIASIFAIDRFAAKGIGGNLLIDLVSSQSSEYRQRIIHHEAGHFLVAHLLGIPIQSYTLSAWESIKAGLPGLGGVMVDTTAIAPTLSTISPSVDSAAKPPVSASIDQEANLEINPEIDPAANLSATDQALSDGTANPVPLRQLNQYCIVWMAGVAAEKRTYGSAQGGQDDELRLKQLWQQIPPNVRATANPDTQTRWALLQAETLIEKHPYAYDALVTAMTQRQSVQTCIQQIESNRPKE